MLQTIQRWPKVVVILVNWNNGNDTIACLDSLSGIDYRNYSVVVVDNGSTDGSGEQISTAHPEAKLLRIAPNRGFAGGCNPGMRLALDAGAEFVWLLNNDTVVRPDALTRMVELALLRRQLGGIGSVLRYFGSPERVQVWGGGRVLRVLGVARHFRRAVAAERLDYVTGASLLLRAEALKDVGLFDERFFLYWEDTDLCFRLREKGWGIAVAEQSSIYHKVGAATGVAGFNKRPPRYYRAFNESLVLFFYKHATVPVIPISISLSGRILKWLLLLDLETVGSVISGAARGLERARSTHVDLSQPGAMRRRSAIGSIKDD